VEERQKSEITQEGSGVVGTHSKVKFKVKFEVFGEEMIEKHVKSSGNSGRVYLPPEWVGHRVKIVRID
jgi:putative transposon-encoded protein